MSKPQSLTLPTGERIAYLRTPGKGATVMFLGGLRSDMTGTKALALEEHAQRQGHGFVRFDYRGHGQSDLRFEETTVTHWREDALAVIDRVTEGPLILVGSSMGGWIALLVALARPERVRGFIGIAAAPDFTEKLMWPAFDESVRRTIEETGSYALPSPYSDEPTVITRDLIADGRRHLLLDAPIELNRPVRLMHGQRDEDVPWEWSLKIADAVTSDDVVVTLNKTGDHRLSSPADLARLCAAVDALMAYSG